MVQDNEDNVKPEWVMYQPGINFDTLEGTEVEILDTFVWGENIHATESRQPEVNIVPCHGLNFVAEVISGEDDGILVIKLGSTVTSLGVEGPPRLDVKWVSGYARRVRVYPTNI